MLCTTLPVTLGTVFYLINSRSDQYILGFTASSTEIATYGLAVQMTEGALLFLAAQMTFNFPLLAKINAQNPSAYNYINIKIFKKLMVSTFVLCSIIILAAPLIIMILFDNKYPSLIQLTILHTLTLVFLGFREFMSRWIVITRNLRMSLYSHGAGAIINVLLNFILIPYIGIYGASISSIISYSVSGIAVFFFAPSTRQDTKTFINSMLESKI